MSHSSGQLQKKTMDKNTGVVFTRSQTLLVLSVWSKEGNFELSHNSPPCLVLFCGSIPLGL